MTEGEGTESFKVVLVGESGVGKTSIITQFIDQEFQADQQSTTGGTFSTKTVICDNGRTLKFEIWDTAGQERYRALAKMFYKDANAAVLVYDVTRQASFDELKSYWAEQVKDNAPADIILAIAGNKDDLEAEVDETNAREYAKELGAIYANTTATTSQSINALFIEIAKKYTGSNEIQFKNEDEMNDQQQQNDKNEGMKLSKEKLVNKREGKRGCC